ncbi:IucA/IucC family siderophore biosynthesis protein [Haloarcula sp. CBA1131]|uniref:IucA/IucC family protein n=1 Tax=Haloarcula sp. CBA1131 TaxID=1853686 RepID=UPI0012480D80|nr:IucA/IucC family siderophore biosynthesis protein [Haloarcula sp. CBA1131]KAA9400963.1 IucA/IucC family siderophore biosynthesis protein [Haloarcula sp. CBA1131]
MEYSDTVRSTFGSDHWKRANEAMLRKIFAEFTREGLLAPTETRTVPAESDEPVEEWTRYVVRLTDGVEYQFDAHQRALGTYRVRCDSIIRRDGIAGTEPEPADDPIQFLVDAQAYLGTSQTTLARLLREYYNTLVADTHVRASKDNRERESILDLPYAMVEGELEGHPKYTYNKGRVGFDYDDYHKYAPETKRKRTLSWVAAHENRATFTSVVGISQRELLENELGDQYQAFRSRLSSDGLDPDDYVLFPVHDWQWTDSVIQLFAGDLADDLLVPLGEGPDTYLPQQSIRTFSNVTDPEKKHVKLPIRVLNTNVYRGILGEQAEAAPRVTEFVQSILDDDPYLRTNCNLVLPGEIAGVNYEHPKFSQLEDAPYQLHELLGCVWRESVTPSVDSSESPIALAAVYEDDFDGTPVVAKLVDRSGMTPETWLTEFLETLLNPILHCLYRYGLVFMPHGTNVVLILEDDVPTRIAITDFVDEVAVIDRNFPELIEKLPEELRDDDRYTHSIVKRKPPILLCHRIVGTLFDGVFRFVSDALERTHGLTEAAFWQHVRNTIENYHKKFPRYEDRYEAIDLFRPRFRNYCLNRNRLLDHGYTNTNTRPKVRHHGTIPNPLAEFT